MILWELEAIFKGSTNKNASPLPASSLPFIVYISEFSPVSCPSSHILPGVLESFVCACNCLFSYLASFSMETKCANGCKCRKRIPSFILRGCLALGYPRCREFCHMLVSLPACLAGGLTQKTVLEGAMPAFLPGPCKVLASQSLLLGRHFLEATSACRSLAHV